MDGPSEVQQRYIEEISALKKRIQELERSEEDLKLSRQQLEFLINAGPDFFFLKDLDLRYQLINTPNARFLGRDQADILGRTDREVMPDGVAALCEESDHLAIRERRLVVSVDSIGDKIYEAHKSPVIVAGKIVGVVGIIRDITARKRAEEELVISRNRLSRAEIISGCGNWEFDFEANRVFASEGARNIYGVSERGWTIAEVQKLPLPEYRGILDRALLGLIRENRPYNVEFKIKRPDTGEVIDILSVAEYDRGKNVVFGVIQDITDRKRAEEELRHKTALLEAQINASLDGIIVVDKDRKTLQNRQMSDLFKIPPHIAGSDDQDEQMKWIRGLARNPQQFDEKVAYVKACPGETVRDELELKDGTVLDMFGSPISGQDGTDYGRIWTFRDITAHKRSEEALLASRVQLSEAMDLASIVYWEFDTPERTFVFNDPFYAFYGTTAEQEGGYRMTVDEYEKRFIHPDDQSRFHQFVEQNVLKPGTRLVNNLECRIVRRDGEVRQILGRVRVVKDDAGRIVKGYGANQDITERRQMERAVWESEEQFREIFERSPFGMVTAAIDLKFIRANEAFCRMLGYSEKELLTLTFKDITHPDHLTEDAAHVNDLITRKIGLYRTEKRYIRKDKGIVWGSSTVTLMRDSDGRFLYSLTTVEDITQRKEAEEEKMRLESQLQQAQKMEAVGTLAGGVAHDFNNILTVITGYGALLKTDLGRNNPLHPYVEAILSSADKAAQLTRSLLSFSRQQPVVLIPLDMNESLRATEKLLKRLLTENIAIRTVLTSEDVIVMADAIQIDQILFNLATNARDAMPKGGTFTMETRIVELDEEFRRFHGYGEPGRYALLSVSDTGVGMNEATRERVFDPFFTTKETGKGTGLGLSIVYGIVRQHNGYVVVYSEPNMGTTFQIYLPTVGKVDREEKPPPVPVKGGSETILIAEDNHSVRGLISKILTEYGYTTLEASDGEEAVERFSAAKRVDLLVFDSVMPKKNGREAYDEIRAIRPDIRVLFTSGYTRDAILNKGVEDKKFVFIPKPISPNVLLQKVREILDQPSS